MKYTPLNNKVITTVLTVFTAVMVFSVWSCNPTKYVPEGEALLDQNSVKINRESVKKEEIEPFIKQKPNKRIFGARFHLGLYNISKLNKNNGFNNWLRKIGEEPVVYDPYSTTKSKEQIKAYLFSKGYFDNNVLETIEIANKKARVWFNIDLNRPYTVKDIKYDIQDTTISKLVFMDSISCMIERGKPYDVDKMKAEQTRVERFIRDVGFYNFTGENINFRVDSTVGNRQVNILYQVKSYQRPGPNKTLMPIPYRQYKVRNIYIYPEYIPRDVLAGGDEYQKSFDTIPYKGYYFVTNLKKSTIKYDIVLQNIYFRPGSTFNLSNTERTRDHLLSLKMYRLANILYTDVRDSSNGKTETNPLNCTIQLTPLSRQSFSVELEGTNSGGNLGGALNLVYQNKNLFKGAEQFNMKLKGAYETFSRDSTGQRNNTREFGLESTLRLPRFLIPFLARENFVKKYNPTTTIQAAYNYQHLPVYTRTLANASIGYQWKDGPYRTHTVNPLQMNFVRIRDINESYNLNVIQKSNYLINSYKDVLIAGGAYSFMFTDQSIKKSKDYWVIRASVEAAGNLLEAAMKLTGAKLVTDSKTNTNSYNILGQPFAQFIKSDIDIRYNRIINNVSSIVYRIFAGAGVPYSNSPAMPFEKQYFEGGANGIRGWQVRSLGPGTYSTENSVYINQTGDIKLETNLEYRFKLLSILEGATFIDAGNIWAIKNDADRPGAQFTSSFYKDLAVGTGLGLRFDLKFVILRADVGVKLRDPRYLGSSEIITGGRTYTAKDTWIFTRGFSFKRDLAMVIAIGYPF